MRRDPLDALRELGQSPWYSYFRGRLAGAGFFREMVRRGTIRGAVLDPVVLARLIEAGDDFDELLSSGPETGGARIDRLLVEELRVGAELFEPVHGASGGRDGFVAVDLSPEVSRRPDESLARGRRLLEDVGRPNVMLRVPGTPDRADTIEAFLAAGISLAVTCLYGVEQALAALGAVQRGLARRVRQGGEPSAQALLVLHPRRIDLVVDEMLDERIRRRGAASDLAEGLLSQVGIATARGVREAVVEATGGREWSRLLDAGAGAPRLCWEGTTSADPRQRDLRYVEALAEASTVVVLAPTTIAALRERGRVDAGRSAPGPGLDELFEDLRALGIDMDEVADGLQGQEVEHRRAVSRALPRLGAGARPPAGAADRYAPGAVERDFRDALRRLARGGAAERLWLGAGSRSAGVGGAASGRPAWLHGVEAMREEALPLTRFAARLVQRRERPVLLLGAGGGYLGAQACADAFERESFLALDSTVPGAVRPVERAIDPGAGLLVLACKSGEVPEVQALAAHFAARWAAAGAGSGERRVAVTDPGTPLHAHATGDGFDGVWLDAPEIDAPRSMLSRSGLVPAALAGIDVGTLLARAHGMALRCAPEVEVPASPALRLAAFLAAVHRAGRDKLTLLLAGRLASLGRWLEQLLVATSCGDGRGLVPVVDEPPGTADAYAGDRAFVHMRVVSEEDPAGEVLARDLEAAGHPVASLRLADASDLGAEFFRWQLAATAAAELICAHTPVSEAEPPALPKGGEGIDAWLAGLRPPAYLAVHAYLAPTVRARVVLQRLRERLRDARGVATTLAWGPGAARTTGRLHRTGPPGTLLQLVAGDPAADGAAPGLAGVARDRARQEAEELRGRGRRVATVELGADVDAGLRRLDDDVDAALGAG